MTIRARLSFWYAAVMLLSLLAMGSLLYEEFAPQRGEGAMKNAKDREDLREAVGIVLMCGVPAGAIALAGGWWLTRKALAPLTALAQSAETINEHNLGVRLPRSGNGDELDRLAQVLNAMTTRLNDSFSRIREFTLHASHELKTPLTILRAETETALKDPALPADQRERCASQLEELCRLTRIVESLTLLAKADAGQVALASEHVNFGQLVQEAFLDAQALGSQKQLTTELAVCEPATVAGDPHRLRQLLLNLVDNAVKYNNIGGRLTLALRKDGAHACFTIENTGPGIAPQDLPRVFERFFRGSAAQTQSPDGCGLGLSLAQWIVTAHKGTIRIESQPQSTLATVRLPLTGAGS